jgi:stage III sporulation protein AD
MEKLVVLVLIFAIIIVYLKSINSEMAMLATICAGVILVFFAFDYIAKSYNFINEIIALTGIDYEFFRIIIKISLIGYLVEFGADTVNDFGLKSLSDKLLFVGKVVIFSVSLPIFYAVINLIKGLLS